DSRFFSYSFFFQAEDGIRDFHVTGVQTCALPIYRHGRHGKPVYGMKAGTVGFLMNQYREDDLPARIAAAIPAVLRPLGMTAISEAGSSVHALAFNEVSLLRQTKQAAKIRILLNGAVRLEELGCDGVLLWTAAGS